MTRLVTAILFIMTYSSMTAASALDSSNYRINGVISSGGGITMTSPGYKNIGTVSGEDIFNPLQESSSYNYSSVPLALAGLSVTGSVGIALLAHSGDINGDGIVDIGDALLALKFAVGQLQPTLPELARGDVAPLVNGISIGDGKIDIEDAVLILRKAVGLGW